MTGGEFCLFRTLQPSISLCIAYDIFDNKLKYVTLNKAKLWTYVPPNPKETCPHCKRTVCNLSAHFVVECSYYKAQCDSLIWHSYGLLGYENAWYSTLLGSSCDLVLSDNYKRFLAESFVFVFNVTKDYVNTYHHWMLKTTSLLYLRM